MIKYLIYVSFLFLFCCKVDDSLSERVSQFEEFYEIDTDSLFIIGLDECTSCTEYYKESASSFLKNGIVVVLAHDSKKANAFLNLKHPSVIWDKHLISKKFNLINESPKVYIKNFDGKIDSLNVIFR